MVVARGLAVGAVFAGAVLPPAMMPAARCRASMSFWSSVIWVCLAAMASEIWLNSFSFVALRVVAVTGPAGVSDGVCGALALNHTDVAGARALGRLFDGELDPLSFPK